MGLTWCLTTTHLPSIIIHWNEFSVSSQIQRVDDERRNTNQNSGGLRVQVFLGLMFGFTDPLENQLISHLVPIRTHPSRCSDVCFLPACLKNIYSEPLQTNFVSEERERQESSEGFQFVMCFICWYQNKNCWNDRCSELHRAVTQ